MNKIHSFHVYLVFMSLTSLLSILLPIIMNWKIAVSSADLHPIVTALQSNEYQICLVIGVSVSAPTFLELLMKVLSARLDFDLTSAVIISSLAIPDLIILTYVRATSDLSAFNFIMKARNIILLWLVLVLIKRYGGNRWSHTGMVTCFTLLCIGRIIAFYKP